MLPILELVFNRLIENDKIPLLSKLVQQYGVLFKYHENAPGLVVDTIYYYYESPSFQQSPESKLLFLKLLGNILVIFISYTNSRIEGPSVTLSDSFKLYLDQKDVNIISSPLYFEQLVQRVANSILLFPTKFVFIFSLTIYP